MTIKMIKTLELNFYAYVQMIYFDEANILQTQLDFELE